MTYSFPITIHNCSSTEIFPFSEKSASSMINLWQKQNEFKIAVELRISPWIFEKIRNGLYGVLSGLGKVIHGKNLKSKISRHFSFNGGGGQSKQSVDLDWRPDQLSWRQWHSRSVFLPRWMQRQHLIGMWSHIELKKIVLGIWILYFGSEVVLLGFSEYKFRILVTVRPQK